MTHEFGGPWTQKKLEILQDYLLAYCTALKNKGLTLHYADAFAGTGSIRNYKQKEGEQSLFPFPLEDLKGSVVTALETRPSFHRYHFNDLNQDHVDALEKLKAQHSRKSITVSSADANEFVTRFCRRLGRYDRAVLFVDPYNTELDWSTLDVVAKSGKIDLWLLFPLSVLLRMTPRDGAKIIPEWEPTINRLLGTSQWKQALYKPKPQPPQQDLFDESQENPLLERVNPEELQAWVKGRLEEIFSFVAPPVMLKNRNAPLYSFIFAVSNRDQRAWGLARKIAEGVLKKHA